MKYRPNGPQHETARLEKLIEAISRPMDEPATWPCWARRLYILTFPLAFCVRSLYCVSFVAAGLIVFVILSCILMVHDVWTGRTNEWS